MLEQRPNLAEVRVAVLQPGLLNLAEVPTNGKRA
jgi:hypothetical protein